MSNSFFDKLSKSEKTFLVVAMVAVFIALFDRVVMQTILHKSATIEEDIRAKESALRSDIRLLSQKDRIEHEGQGFSAYAVEGTSQEEEISTVLKEIERLAREASVNLIEIKPTDLKAEKVVKKYVLSVSAEGTLSQLAAFIFRMESSKNLFAVDTYSLTVKDRDKGILRCAMSISKIVVP